MRPTVAHAKPWQVLMDEESAFWMLDVVCDDLCPAYYTRDMRGAVIYQQILSDLVREHCTH